jgi:hypothetical protein
MPEIIDLIVTVPPKTKLKANIHQMKTQPLFEF